MRHLLFVIILLVSAGSGVGQELPHVSLPQELRKLLDDYEAAWRNHDAVALASLFTANGIILRPGHPPVKGTSRIANAYKDSGGPLVLRAYDYAIEGTLAYILGGYTSHEDEPDQGKFTLVLKKSGNIWRIHSDMDNASHSY